MLRSRNYELSINRKGKILYRTINKRIMTLFKDLHTQISK